MKKNAKNIMLGTLSVIGASTILGIGLSVADINKKAMVEKNELINSSKLISTEKFLTRELVTTFGWDIKAEITLNDWKTIPPNITKIGSWAFYNSKVTLITIPNYITSIENFAFKYTQNLLSFNFEPNSQLESIGHGSFEASSIKSIDIPKSVKTISQEAFSRNHLLTSVILPPTLTELSPGIFFSTHLLKEVIIPKTVTKIGHRAFDLSAITKIVIPNSVVEIFSSAFINTNNLTDITMPKKFQAKLPSYGFTKTQWDSIKWVIKYIDQPNNASNITAEVIKSVGFDKKKVITLADWAEYLPNATQISGAFQNNIILTSIDIPDSIISLEDNSFNNANNLSAVKFGPASQINLFNKNLFRGTKITSMIVPPSVRTIHQGAFALNDLLTSVILPPTLTELPTSLFRNTPFLQEVILPETLVSIGTAAFQNSGITKIVIPNSVLRINKDAFKITNNLTDITMPLKFGAKLPSYGFTKTQWDSIKWIGTDSIQSAFGIEYLYKQDVITQVPPTPVQRVTMTENAKVAGLTLEFSLGSSLSKLIIPWSTSWEFDKKIEDYSKTKDILHSENNIYTRMYLPDDGTGPESDIVDGILYKWNKEPQKIYDSSTGTIANTFVDRSNVYIDLPAGNITATTARLLPDWYSSIKVEGELLDSVSILSNSFSFPYYQERKIDLQVLAPNTSMWENINAFNAKTYDASLNQTFKFRLNIAESNKKMYKMWNTINSFIFTSPVIEIIAKGKKEINVNPISLTDSTHLSVTGSTINLKIKENDSLFFMGTESLEEMKKILFIRYSIDDINYISAAELITNLSKLRSISLNDFDLTKISARFEFTDYGKENYFSSKVFGDLTYTPRVNYIDTATVQKDLDLTAFINEVPLIQGQGTTISIEWLNLLNTAALSAMGVAVQWSYWTTIDKVVTRSAWEILPPNSVTMLKNPDDLLSLFPISVRFVKVAVETTNNGLFDFSITNAPTLVDIVKGYKPDLLGLGEVITFTELIGINYKIDGAAGNVVSMNLTEKQIDVFADAASKLEMQFSLGESKEKLTIPWANATDFKAAIATHSETNDILKSEFNIFIKLVLKAGTGPEGDVIGEIKYIWDKTENEIYNNVIGLNGIFAIGVSDSKIRLYSKIVDSWSESLSAEGKKSSKVKIINRENKFDIEYYKARGISLQVSPDTVLWSQVNEFNTEVFNAAVTNTMSFRLIIIKDAEYEMYGNDVNVSTHPSGNQTNITVKPVIAKIEWKGLNSSELETNKINISGTTHNFIINESDELYTSMGQSLEEAKKFLKIKYSFDGVSYFTHTDFSSELNRLRTKELNDLSLLKLRVRYEFTAEELLKYYSTEVFNDPDAIPASTIWVPDTSKVIKTLDLNEYIIKANSVKLLGTTLDIKYADELDITKLSVLGVKIQWSYWTIDDKNSIIRSMWVDEKPTVSMLKNPINPDGFHPIAIRFVKIDETNVSIELKNIVKNTANETDILKGYAVDVTGLNEIISFKEKWGTNYQVRGISGNVVSMNISEVQLTVSDLAKEKFQMQFAIGLVSNNLTIDWANVTDFKAAIATFNGTNDILKHQLNIYARLILIGGTGVNSDTIGNTRYIWDKKIVEVYNNEAGVVSEFNTTDPAGSKLRAYARINANWATLYAEGNKSDAVFIQSQDNIFDMVYYKERGVFLQVSVDGKTNWIDIEAFGTIQIDASATNKMSFRLVVREVDLYEIYGDVIVITTPVGKETNIIEKDIIAKIELVGVVASDLITDKLKISGSTHDFAIIESDELYTISGMTVEEAKKFFEIKYTFDGIDYFTNENFTKKLNDLRGFPWNKVDLSQFKVRYEFTVAGLEKYYSLEVFNDPEAVPDNTIKILNTEEIIKSIDVTKEIASIQKIELTGTTEKLTWSGMGLINSISEFVTVEYGTYSKTDLGVVYSWSNIRPTSIYTKTTPEGQVNYPVAIRFIPKLPTDKVEIGSIASKPSPPLLPVDIKLGYSVDISKITAIINIDTTELVNKLLLSGYASFLNGGATSKVIEQAALELVDSTYRNDIKLSYEISIKPGIWYSLDQLKEFMLSYSSDFANVNSGIMIFNNGVIPGVTIIAKFVSKIPNAFIINATPEAQTLLKTDKIKTNINLKEYVKILQTVKVITSGTSSAGVGTLLISGMTPGNVLFGGKTYLEIEQILKSSIQMEFKASGFNGDAWITLDKITAVNFNNDLFIRFIVKPGAETNIELSLVDDNDYKDHLETGFKLILALPNEIQVDSKNLITFISVTGNTKNIVIDDSKVYEDLIAKDPSYEGKAKILYTIGTTPIKLDPTKPEITEFSKDEFIRLLSLNNTDITLVQKQITARYALADGVSEEEFIIKDKKPANLNIENLLLFINKSNYYELARNLKVSGTSSAIVWDEEIIDLKNTLSEGLIIQYSIDPTALVIDATDDVKWPETQPTTISPTDKFLAIRLVTKTGYVFEEETKLFVVDTSNVLLIIELQKIWMQNIQLTGNAKNININTTVFENMLATKGVPGKEFIFIEYYFGGKAPAGLGIEPNVEWFTAEQIKIIFETLEGSKNSKELILFRDSLQSRYSLNDEGFKDYRLNIDGVNSDEQMSSKPEFYESLVTATVNASFKGYINLDLMNVFTPDSFKVVGSDEALILQVGNEIGKMLEYYKNPATSPFDIYYTNKQGDFTNKEYKLFGEAGFIKEFHPSFKILLDVLGDTKPIWFKLEERNGYQVWENNKLLANGKIIKITDIVVEKQIRNPLTEAPDIKFNAADGSSFYQGEGSLSVYVKGTNALVDSTFLNATHPNILPVVLKLEYNINDFEYSPEELKIVKLDPTKWVDEAPTNLSAGQFVMVRVDINNDKFTMIGEDTITPQIRVRGLVVHADKLSVEPTLKLTNIDHYGYDTIDGQTRIEEAKMVVDVLGNYLGADLLMSVETEFYKSAIGMILIDANGIPIVKRDPIGATQAGNYLDRVGNEILDQYGNPIPKWTIEKSGRIIPAPPLRTGMWQKPIPLEDITFLGTFSQEETSAQWKLFDSQFIKLSFVPRVGEGTLSSPDFIFDKSIPVDQEIQLSNIKYPVQTRGIQYEFLQKQVDFITYASDHGEELPYTGNTHISSEIIMLRKDEITERELSGEAISEEIKVDFEGKVEINMLLNRKNGSPQSASGTKISQFKDLQNGDIITISFKSTDDIFLLPNPIEPLVIIVKDLYVKPLSDDLFKYLRPNFVGVLNGSGSFGIRVTNPNNSTDTIGAVFGLNQWYEYQVWNTDKTLKTEWTKDETKINNLVNGDKVEWKIINKDDVFDQDYYNTLLDNTNIVGDEIKFRVVNVIDNIEQTFKKGIGSSQSMNPDVGGIAQYPENSGWIVSGLKVEITLDETQQAFFEEALRTFEPTFSGVNKFGSMQSEVKSDPNISKDVELVWYTSSQDGEKRKITNFNKAELSNGDEVWVSIAPSLEAKKNNLIIDESISSLESTKYKVSGLTTIVNSSTQTLMIALITSSSVLFVGLVGLIIFVNRNKKLNNNKGF